MDKKVVAIVVTYNRKKLLKECLEAIFAQTVRIDTLILIDNASTDGTNEFLKENGFMDRPGFSYNLMDSNLGGSGGFYEGMKRVSDDADWVWIMDDDTIPNPDCLEKLLNASTIIKEDASFFASSVFGPENEPMNVPSVDFSLTENGYPDWYFNLNQKMVKIKNATFVSLLIRGAALRKCGLPCRDYFIWGDDTEYTTRLTTYYGPAYMVGDSVVCHKRIGAKALAITNENDPKRIANYFYYYRNLLINDYVYKGKKEGNKVAIRYFGLAIKLLRKKLGFSKSRTIIKAIIEGIFCWKSYEKYIKHQIGDM